jgi:hypothetical protein
MVWYIKVIADAERRTDDSELRLQWGDVIERGAEDLGLQLGDGASPTGKQDSKQTSKKDDMKSRHDGQFQSSEGWIGACKNI